MHDIMPKLTIALATNRPHNWRQYCDRLTNVTVDMEVIFIGPYDTHGHQFPIPVKSIITDVKPAQCWAIGANAARGDFLCLSSDDFCNTDGFFEDAIELAKTSTNLFDSFTGRFVDDRADLTPGAMLLGQRNMPIGFMNGISFTEGYHKLGGLDRRFYACLWDTDLYMRQFIVGGRCVLLPAHVAREHSAGSTMFSRHSAYDIAVLKSLWFREGKATIQRNSPVESYTEAEVGRIVYRKRGPLPI